ncbi:unnamed protein product [Caenorhabditis angaria]|uniref:Uncharacterized protein n=1 Tax=Caenorhabditis angaria TaxID=860376 RepID=A0A9P1IFQ1_9PELO|nr:unnamed protein product [Caenorhabditis angaria]
MMVLMKQKDELMMKMKMENEKKRELSPTPKWRNALAEAQVDMADGFDIAKGAAMEEDWSENADAIFTPLVKKVNALAEVFRAVLVDWELSAQPNEEDARIVRYLKRCGATDVEKVAAAFEKVAESDEIVES